VGVELGNILPLSCSQPVDGVAGIQKDLTQWFLIVLVT
jgi:hypothetical protein